MVQLAIGIPEGDQGEIVSMAKAEGARYSTAMIQKACHAANPRRIHNALHV
jgi:hypothetical protein